MAENNFELVNFNIWGPFTFEVPMSEEAVDYIHNSDDYYLFDSILYCQFIVDLCQRVLLSQGLNYYNMRGLNEVDIKDLTFVNQLCATIKYVSLYCERYNHRRLIEHHLAMTNLHDIESDLLYYESVSDKWEDTITQYDTYMDISAIDMANIYGHIEDLSNFLFVSNIIDIRTSCSNRYYENVLRTDKLHRVWREIIFEKALWHYEFELCDVIERLYSDQYNKEKMYVDVCVDWGMFFSNTTHRYAWYKWCISHNFLKGHKAIEALRELREENKDMRWEGEDDYVI